ncbi:unnamed protein product [Tilletia laevis]|uniref:Impact N-terminal domain-containing protein n=2 Tax=Tilletia TaxID=13289 RepID=A0A177TY82_9BASI|nr:hypothetical protein CF336_g7069 [Tilletia laevis]KAE8246332.1 hypothetical protein A4X03_0g7278 [Tilletia caries]KAE8187404.1 hypothetical protein CF335_g7182 [Tilletia laevis]CAD6891486.1 unnamed protein product [Tilletia caries]CAD6922072.1 unnamed protein product [Tilletia caries]
MSASKLRARAPRLVDDGEGIKAGARAGNASVDEEDQEDEELPSRPWASIQSRKGKGATTPSDPQRTQDGDEDEEEEEEVFFSEDDSADEWTPQQSKKPSSSSSLPSNKRARYEDEDDDLSATHEDHFSEDEEDRPAAPKKRSKNAESTGRGGEKAASSSRRPTSQLKGSNDTINRHSTTPAGPSSHSSSSKPTIQPSKPNAIPSTATSTSTKPNLGRAAGLAALAQGSNISAKEIIDRLHRARAMAENDFRRARGEDVVDLDGGGEAEMVQILGSAGDGKGRAVDASASNVASSSRPRTQVPASSNSEERTSGRSTAKVPPSQPVPTSSSSSSSAQASNPPARISVASWLGVVPHDSDLPWPTITPPESMIQDRDSLFIAFVFPFPPPPPLSSSSPAAPVPASTFPTLISSLLSHLVRTVQPASVPIPFLPDHLRSAPVGRRGASHDMYAVRAKVLKFGRDGSRGGVDWTSWEGADDDGEKWGAQKIAKVIQEENAENVLVFVSRWYGGVLLGPDRFTHITDVARATLRLHMENQRVAQLRQSLEELDARATSLRASLSKKTDGSGFSPNGKPTASVAATAYADLTEAKGQRLLVAKRKMVELLEKKVKEQGGVATGVKKPQSA